MLNTIGDDGPLVKLDITNGLPIDDFQQNGETCHPQKMDGGKLTTEIFWGECGKMENVLSSKG